MIGQLSSELDVFISIRPKAKQPVQSAIIKSIEQNILCVYKVGVVKDTWYGEEVLHEVQWRCVPLLITWCCFAE